MKLRTHPDPILRVTCEPADTRLDYSKIAQQMFEAMKIRGGVGLAAPQVGLEIRMFVWNPHSNMNPKYNRCIINPELIVSEDLLRREEGCLSLPGTRVVVTRNASSTMSGFSHNGERVIHHGYSLETRIWQHELDHLNGILIIDHKH